MSEQYPWTKVWFDWKEGRMKQMEIPAPEIHQDNEPPKPYVRPSVTSENLYGSVQREPNPPDLSEGEE